MRSVALVSMFGLASAWLALAAACGDDGKGGDETVKSPGELTISAYAPVPDVRKVVTPDGALVYAFDRSVSPAVIFALDTLSGEKSTEIRVNTRIERLLLNYEGSKLYAAGLGALFAVDTATNDITAEIAIGEDVAINTLALSLDGASLFVNHTFEAKFVRIDTRTNEVVEEFVTLEGGTPDSSTLAVIP